MDTNFLEVKDENGTLVRIPYENLTDLHLFGMDIKTIIALRKEYLKRGGLYPITKENVELCFKCQ